MAQALAGQTITDDYGHMHRRRAFEVGVYNSSKGTIKSALKKY